MYKEKLQEIIIENYIYDKIDEERFIRISEKAENISEEKAKKISKVLTEGFFRSEKSTYWYEEIITIEDGIKQIKKMADKYLIKVKKEHPDYLDEVALVVTIAVDPTIKSVISKEKRGKSYITLILRDDNDVLDKLNDYEIGRIKLTCNLIF